MRVRINQSDFGGPSQKNRLKTLRSESKKPARLLIDERKDSEESYELQAMAKTFTE